MSLETECITKYRECRRPDHEIYNGFTCCVPSINANKVPLDTFPTDFQTEIEVEGEESGGWGRGEYRRFLRLITYQLVL